MKPSDIAVGSAYHDGKQGLREVIAKDGAPVTVTYRILAAKQSQEWDLGTRTMLSLIGSVSTISLEGFAKWAKGEVLTPDIEAYLQRLEAAKLKLSAGELAFMESIKQEEVPVKLGTMISFDHTEGRAVSGLQKKGLLLRHQNEAELTSLGAAWLAIDAIRG